MMSRAWRMTEIGPGRVYRLGHAHGSAFIAFERERTSASARLGAGEVGGPARRGRQRRASAR